jgi:hypothetical protein
MVVQVGLQQLQHMLPVEACNDVQPCQCPPLAVLLHSSRHLEPVHFNTAFRLSLHQDTVAFNEQVFRLFQRFLAAESRIDLGFFILGVLVSHRPDHPVHGLMADVQRSQGAHCFRSSPVDTARRHFGNRVQKHWRIPLVGCQPQDPIQ